jgi:hypothetical protein
MRIVRLQPLPPFVIGVFFVTILAGSFEGPLSLCGCSPSRFWVDIREEPRSTKGLCTVVSPVVPVYPTNARVFRTSFPADRSGKEK